MATRKRKTGLLAMLDDAMSALPTDAGAQRLRRINQLLLNGTDKQIDDYQEGDCDVNAKQN